MTGSFVKFILDLQLGNGLGFPVDPGACEERRGSLWKDMRGEAEVR